MNTPKALRVYRGPDSHVPFMGVINQLSFKCRLMANTMAKNSIQKLSSVLPNGKVVVMRVGSLSGQDYGIEYVNTWGTERGMRITLIASESKKYSAAVSIGKNSYRFPVLISGVIGRFTIYDGYETSIREACPYIIFGNINYVSVGLGWDGWHSHSSIYIGQPDLAVESDDIFRPYGRTWSYHAGPIVHWHSSMSPVTAIANHIILTRYIDNQKKNYWPHNMLVTFEENQHPEFFTVISPAGTFPEAGAEANLVLPANALAVYGKRPSTTGDSYGESIAANHPATINLSGDGSGDGEILPVMFFWPWIPYMDEIGHFNLLSVSGTSVFCYGISPMYVWNLRSYAMDGTLSNDTKLTDVATFANSTQVNTYEYPITEPNNTNNADNTFPEDPCATVDPLNLPASYPDGNPCYNATGTEARVNTTTGYSSSGTKHIPIGTVGNKGVCYVKTDWNVSGSGPVYTYTKGMETKGNLPVGWFVANGSMVPMEQYWPAGTYRNNSKQDATWTEIADNRVDLAQTLMFGDDVIDTGISTMSYSMSRSGSSALTGSWEIVLEKVGGCTPGESHIDYTTDEMYIGTSQTFTAVVGSCKCNKIYWTASRGTILSTAKIIQFTVPEPTDSGGCGPITISAMCDCGDLIGTVSINVLGYPGNTHAYQNVPSGVVARADAYTSIWWSCLCQGTNSIGHCDPYYGEDEFSYITGIGTTSCGAKYDEWDKLGSSCSLQPGCTVSESGASKSECTYVGLADLRTLGQKFCGCNPPSLLEDLEKREACMAQCP